MLKAAGILFIAGETALFLRRGNGSDTPNTWGIPGGKVEDGETLEEAAIRETQEEAGVTVKPDMLKPWTRAISAGGSLGEPAVEGQLPAPGYEVDFSTYVVRLQEQFTPVLNDEHDGYCWAPLTSPPLPIHPGVQIALDRVSMDELGIARAMAEGRLTSPQSYHNMWLFNIRITGTGASYRHKRQEYVWREPSLYLNDDFLARCNGLSVIWEHPEKNLLDSNEYADRNIGSVFLPYIPAAKPDEVWAIAKIYDDNAAAEMRDGRLSTSPAVKLPVENLDNVLTMEGGATVLIEDAPVLLDHIAVCEQGVWDKGGEPVGVDSVTVADDANTLVYADSAVPRIEGLEFLRAHTAMLLVNAQFRATSNRRSA